MNHDIRKNVITGMCPVCHSVIRKTYSDKYHNVCYCTGCGLEYGNPGMWRRYGTPKKVLNNQHIKALLDDAYNQLVDKEPYLDVQIIVNCLDIVAKQQTGYGCPDIPLWKLHSWGYEVVSGNLVRKVIG